MIVDATFFRDELHMLEKRLELLAGVVDVFVFVEATTTFSGTPKEPTWDPKRFEKYEKKIRYILVEDMKHDPSNLWVAENFQRNAVMRGLRDICRPNDTVMISDCDEIPNPMYVRSASRSLTIHRAIAFQQRMFFYSWKWMKKAPWHGTVMTHFKWLAIYGPQYFRNSRDSLTFVKNGGWHLSWFGDVNDAKKKLQNCLHTEYDFMKANNDMEESIDKGLDVFRRGQHEDLVETEGIDEIAAILTVE